MAPAKSARAKKFAAFEDKAVKGTRASSQFTEVNEHTILSDSSLADYDPEANPPSEDESDSEAEEDLAGTEHYVNVGYVLLERLLPWDTG